MEKLNRFLNEALTYWLLACSIGTTLVPGKENAFCVYLFVSRQFPASSHCLRLMMLTEPLENRRSSSPQRKAFVFQVLKSQNIFLQHCYCQLFMFLYWRRLISLLSSHQLFRWITLLSREGFLEKLFLLVFMKVTTTYLALFESVWLVVHVVIPEAQSFIVTINSMFIHI